MRFLKPGGLKLYLLLLVLMLFNTSQGQDVFKVFLVGDAGDSEESGETLINLQKEINKNPNSAVIFLGDNSYKDILWGLIHFGYRGFDSTENTRGKILSQLALLKDYKGFAYFVPGNHDWWNLDYRKGKPKLAMEQSFIQANLKTNENIANPNQVFLPENGEYGPAYVELNNRTLRIIFIDTYRIIQNGLDKKPNSTGEKEFYDSLENVIREGYKLQEKVMIVAHHPVHGVGPYNRPLKHPYLFGRIKASMSNFPSYEAMSDKINAILKRYPGIYYASGHIHALQYFFTKDSIHYIVSGAGSHEKILNVKNIHKYDATEVTDEYILWNNGGFFEVEFSNQYTTTLLYYNNGLSKCKID